MNCPRWLELIAAYKAGSASNQGQIDALESREKTDDDVARESDDDVNRRLSEWNRDK